MTPILIPANFSKAVDSFTTPEWNKRGSHRLDKRHLLIKYSTTRIVILCDREIVGVYNRYTYGGRACILPKFKGQYRTETKTDANAKSAKPPGDQGLSDQQRPTTGSVEADQPRGNTTNPDAANSLFE